jgi:hypothetical protein
LPASCVSFSNLNRQLLSSHFSTRHSGKVKMHRLSSDVINRSFHWNKDRSISYVSSAGRCLSEMSLWTCYRWAPSHDKARKEFALLFCQWISRPCPFDQWMRRLLSEGALFAVVA